MSIKQQLNAWFYEGSGEAHSERPKQDPWWKVMCLTGTDYFSSMGFQPGISYLAAGLLAPHATLMLILLTLFGALPAYNIVAKESPHGKGSFAIFERLFSGWAGKSIVLILIGFAATDFIFTITMCAADATVHIIENPWMIHFAHEQLIITMTLITLLGVVFLCGFQEAITVSFILVVFFLCVNAYAFAKIFEYLFANPHLSIDWLRQVNTQFPSPSTIFVSAALAFPQLALGLSGFETGVAVMPLIKTEQENSIPERIAKTKLLLITVAIIMGGFLFAGSYCTAVIIPAELFQEGGAANGRALAYLAHKFGGNLFGTIYDIATVLILWFAGASGMAALLSFVPQYLPRYGMAPDWARARRPLVIVFTTISLIITFLFKADVDAQAAPFATGLLVLITSAVTAVTISLWKTHPILRIYFALISGIFVYASISVMIQKPDGLAIALMFVIAIISSSLISRTFRSTELRIGKVILDSNAAEFLRAAREENLKQIRLLAHRPGHSDYATKEAEARRDHSIQNAEGNFIFLEIEVIDSSEFTDTHLEITGHLVDGFQILRCQSPTVPNAVAALLLHLRDLYGEPPHAYLAWTEGHPISYMIKYILFGEGETAPLTREILRGQESDANKRPKIHVA